MHSLTKEISQISIYLKEKAEKVNEVALFQPLLRSSQFDESSKPLTSRKKSSLSSISFCQRMCMKMQRLFFNYFPQCIPSERLTVEAKFKTVLAILLTQEEMRDFFLNDPLRQKTFLKALTEAAHALGYSEFAPTFSSADTPLMICRQLTQLAGKKTSLLEDQAELNLQISTLKHHERSEMLYKILNCLERPPIHSVIEVTLTEKTHSIPLTTQYAKYKVQNYDASTGQIRYSYLENHATSSVRTQKNMLPDAKGAMNQRSVVDSEEKAWIGSYCGELSTSYRVLEQLLLIFNQTHGEAQILSHQSAAAVEKKVLFSSLYSWDEYSLITNQQTAIEMWDKKTLKCQESFYNLSLLYFNIPFNAWNKYPAPSEIKAHIQDINDETTIHLIQEAYTLAGMPSEELKVISERIFELKKDSSLRMKNKLLDEIDVFRELKNSLLERIETLQTTPLVHTIKTLLTERKPNGKPLKGMDKLLYLDFLSAQLGYVHNKNCQNATDRCAAADAADKAQYAFRKLNHTFFLPGLSSEEETELFKVLYSMYLVWEEPEINTWMSTGFLGEKFYDNFFQKNPEATHYLVCWLKKNPEFYLGLSGYRM